MRDLHEMNFGERAMLTVAIVVIILILLAAFGYLTGRWDEAGAAPEVSVAPSKWDGRIGELEKEAIEEGFKQHIVQLYKIWVTDNYQPKFPPKAVVGARNARDAFIRSMDAIEERGQLISPAK